MTIVDALHVLQLIEDYARTIASKLDDEVRDGRGFYESWNEATDAVGGYLDSALILMEKAAGYYAEENVEKEILK